MNKSSQQPDEEPAVAVEFRENGPAVITGSVIVRDETGERFERRLFLCRCGESASKPQCDGTHKTCGFTAPGVPVVAKTAAPVIP